MENLTDTIGTLCNLLEDAFEEKDWELVQIVTNRLNELYEESDKSDYDY